MQINEKDFISFITVKQGLAEESVRHCRIRIKIINNWFTEKELNKENIELFFMELKVRGLKNNTLNTYYFVLRQVRDYCNDRGLPSNFLDGFKSFKKSKPDIIVFTLDEIERLLNTSLEYGLYRGKDTSFLDLRNRTLSMFLAYTGCRFSEATNLRIKRLDLSAGRATFIETKTNENRSVYFTEPLKSNLAKLIENKNIDDLVFRNANEKRINAQDYSCDLKKRALKAGIVKRVFPHNFRHSYITHLIEAGVPITEVASLVGHKDIRTTYSTYMHLADKVLFKAAMRHPSVRRNVPPLEILRNIKELIDNQKLDSDNRFMHEIIQKNGGLSINISVKSEI